MRGLPAGTQFQRDAVTAGEAVIVGRDESTTVGLVPDFEYDELEDESDFEPEPTALSWTVYSVPGAPTSEYPDLGEPAAFACSNRICSFPSFNAEELQATVKQMAKLKPARASLN